MIPVPPIETQRRIAETARLRAKERLLAAQLTEAKDEAMQRKIERGD